MEINNSTSIDESMREALLEWVRQFSSGSVSWSDLMDGFILNDVMSKITQNNALKQLRESFLKQTCDKEAIVLEEWIHLIDTIFSFYQDSLQYLVFIKPPDVQVICNNPNSDEALKEVELAVLMILGCAVLCSHKKEFVEQIRSLDISHHPAIVRCIKEITEKPDDNFLHISQISPDKFALISKNLNKQNIAKRMIQMRQEILAQKNNGERQVNDKGGGDDDDNDEMESLENVKRNLNDVIEVQECKIKELKILLDDRTEKLEDVQKNLEKSREKMTFLEEQNILLSREASTVNAHISELEAANEKASKLSQLERKHSKLQKKLADLEFWKQQAGHMAEENEKMCRLNEQLENEVDGLKKKCEELKFCEAEVARFEKEVKENEKARKNDVDLIRELTYEKQLLEIENNKLLKLSDSNKPLTKEYQNQQKWSDHDHDDDDDEEDDEDDDENDDDGDDDDESKKETTKLDESFATLYELGTTPGSTRQSLTIETARLIDIDGFLMESCTQTEDAGREDDDDDNDDGAKRRKSWKVSKEEMELNDTVDNLSVEIRRMKDFVKQKDASILLMNLKVTEKTRECERLLAEVEECKKSHQIQIDQLKAQSSNYVTGTEALRSRLATAQKKIDNLKQDRERIRLELDSFSERITNLIIENNKLLAQHEASIAMCSRVEDENVKLLDQLRETLGQNQELLSLILTSKDHRVEEQKSYIEQLSDLKHNKEKLEEKIFEFLRKKEKKSLGFGTLVRKMKNKPTKSEQFLMSLESPRKMPETSSDQDSKDSESRDKYLEKKRDNYSPPSHASTSCLLPPQKHLRNMAPKLSFSQTVKTNMADNKKLFRSEMNVTWPDDGDGRRSEHETKDLSVDEKMIANFPSNDLQNSAHENAGGNDENVHASINDNENQILQVSLQKCESTEATTCSNNENKQPNETDQSTQMSQYDEQINKDNEENEKIFSDKSEKSMAATNDLDLKSEFHEIKDENNPETTFITRFKTSRDLTSSKDGGEQSPSNDDDIANTSQAGAKQIAEDEIFLKGFRSTSVPHAHYDSGIEAVGEINRRSNQRKGKRFRALSELNIRFSEMKSPATKPSIFKTSLKSAFSAAGRKIVREMSHLKGMVSWKGSPGVNLVQDTGSKNLASEYFKNMPCGNMEESKDQHGSSEISYCKARSDVKEIDRSTRHSDIDKIDSNVPHSSKLTFENLAERRTPKTIGESECEFNNKLESTDSNQKDQMNVSALARPKRKKQAPNLSEKHLSSSSSNSSSKSSLSKKKLETNKLSTSSSSSLSSSPILPYKESNVCI